MAYIRCDKHKEWKVHDSTCRDCFPKDDKSDRAEVNALIAGGLKKLPRVRNYIDSKGMA